MTAFYSVIPRATLAWSLKACAIARFLKSARADKKLLGATLNSSLNKSVSEIQLWASANKLPLNEDKTKVLTITGKRCVANINGSDIDVIVAENSSVMWIVLPY